jgi:hypothetical protein
MTGGGNTIYHRTIRHYIGSGQENAICVPPCRAVLAAQHGRKLSLGRAAAGHASCSPGCTANNGGKLILRRSYRSPLDRTD